MNDVLSSIRRLVSEEAKARLEYDQPAPAPQEAPAPADPLMLTPDYAVVPPAKRPAAAEAAPVEAEPARDTLVLDTGRDEKPDAPFHDEVALRALVSEMIREELQGELGDRITRNVRKLIRREIEIALNGRS